MERIIRADCADILPRLPAAFARLIYIDPPFNTGRTQRRDRIAVAADPAGTRTGFGGRRYRAEPIGNGRAAFGDAFGGAYLDFLMPRIAAGLRCLTPDGSLMVHLDAREVHHVKVALDGLLGRRRFMNEIIWAYDFGGRPKNRWPAKHDTILWYAMDPRNYVFNYDAIDRIPYMAPGLAGPEKAARGKTPTDVWWHTIVPTSGREKTGYPTQKPLGILRRIIAVHTRPNDAVLDFFAGSGTTGAAAAELGRGFVLIDSSAQAARVMRRRLGVQPEAPPCGRRADSAGLRAQAALRADDPARVRQTRQRVPARGAVSQAAAPRQDDEVLIGAREAGGKDHHRVVARRAGRVRGGGNVGAADGHDVVAQAPRATDHAEAPHAAA